MGFCSDNERFYAAKQEYNRLKSLKPSLVMSTFYAEQEWRNAGEDAIKREMERRLDAHYISKRKKTG